MSELYFSLQLRNSRWMFTYVVIVHVALISSLYYLSISVETSIAVSLLIVGNCCYSLWRYSNKARSFWINRLEYIRQNWQIVRSNSTSSIQLNQITVWRWLVVLNYTADDLKRNELLIVFADAAEQDQFRQFRVILSHYPIWDKPSSRL